MRNLHEQDMLSLFILISWISVNFAFQEVPPERFAQSSINRSGFCLIYPMTPCFCGDNLGRRGSKDIGERFPENGPVQNSRSVTNILCRAGLKMEEEESPLWQNRQRSGDVIHYLICFISILSLYLIVILAFLIPRSFPLPAVTYSLRLSDFLNAVSVTNPRLIWISTRSLCPIILEHTLHPPPAQLPEYPEQPRLCGVRSGKLDSIQAGNPKGTTKWSCFLISAF